MKIIFGAAILAAATATALPASAAPAGAFLRDAAKGDASEVSLGRLAIQRAGSPGVRAFGQRLVRDHGGHLIQVRRLARQMRIGVAGVMKPDARLLYGRLSRLRGPAFDRMFARHMVDDHRQDIAAYEEQARTGDRMTASFARQTLPTLRAHLRIAESLAR